MKYSISILLIFSILLAENCIDSDRAYRLGVSETKSNLARKRLEDKVYLPQSCPCTAGINIDVQMATLKITENRVNPATDLLIKALENQLVASDTKIRELVNLKYVNSMYSFYDKQDAVESTLSSQVDGCGEAFHFSATHNTSKYYREGILIEILSVLHSLKKSADMLEVINKKKMIIKDLYENK